MSIGPIMVSKAVSSRAPSNASSLVRRNLFHHHLSRRPSSTLTSTSATTLPDLPLDSSSEIVMRDPHGNYAVQIPLLPPLEEDQVPEDETTEREKLETRFIEMYKNRSIPSGEPAELLIALQSSLKRKVASLDDDNWMFESEKDTPG